MIARLSSEELLSKYASQADDIANLGCACIDELRAFLAAIVDLSREHSVIHDLAKVAVEIADERFELIGRSRLNAKEKLAALRAGAGGAHA